MNKSLDVKEAVI